MRNTRDFDCPRWMEDGPQPGLTKSVSCEGSGCHEQALAINPLKQMVLLPLQATKILRRKGQKEHNEDNVEKGFRSSGAGLTNKTNIVGHA